MKMHWCTATVNLAGKNLTHVVFDVTQPVSWPEIQVITLLHGGPENVYDIKPVAISETTPIAEKERLAIKYRYAPVEQVFPGRSPRMEMLMPGEPENQPLADDEGHPIGGNGNGHPIEEPPAPAPQPAPQPPEDDEDEDATAPADQPPAAVFKPGRHTPRPQKGA